MKKLDYANIEETIDRILNTLTEHRIYMNNMHDFYAAKIQAAQKMLSSIEDRLCDIENCFDDEEDE